MEAKLYEAANNGNESAAKEILREDPMLNVNWSDDAGWTALHVSCSKGHNPVITLLLAHPNIEVNKKDVAGNTPFMWVCFNGKASSVGLLLMDPRVLADESNSSGFSPLVYVASLGHLETIKCWIASGRDLPLGEPGNVRKDAIHQAKNPERNRVVNRFLQETDEEFEARAQRCALGASLLEQFKANPDRIRGKFRKELGLSHHHHHHPPPHTHLPLLSFHVHRFIHSFFLLPFDFRFCFPTTTADKRGLFRLSQRKVLCCA